MFSQAKFEEDSEITQFLASSLSRKLFCRTHGHLYQYRCMHPHCNSFTCGQIECIDNHFHQNQLKIQKFDTLAVMRKIKHIQDLSGLPEMLTPGLNELKKSVDHLKQRSNSLFKLYKTYKCVADFLREKIDEPIREDYLKAMDEFSRMRIMLQAEIAYLSSSINWKTVWISLEDELEIAQKLKISFVEFKNMYFQQFEPGCDFFEANGKCEFFKSHECEGIVLLYFTDELCVIGEFIPSDNVDTCRVFVHNFVFVVNSSGEIDQYSTARQVISFQKAVEGQESRYSIRIIDKQICEKEGLQELAIRKMVCFLVYADAS